MNTKRHPFIFLINILIFFTVILLHYTDLCSINIGRATLLLILPLMTAFSLFHSPIACALTGLFAGIFMDACTIGSYCFNAIILLCIGTFVSVSSNNLFNKNLPSAMVLSLITSAVYFIMQWIVFHTDNVTLDDSLIYLLRYAFPSAVLSAVFIIPLYYLYKHFHKISSE